LIAMRVLFTCHGAAPHLYPMVPLAWAFRAAGHEVRVASETKIVDQIVHTGLPAIELTSTPQWTEREREETVRAIWTQGPWPPDWALDIGALTEEQRAYLEFLGRRLVRGADAVTDELSAFAHRWAPDLIVHDALAFAGAVVAAQLGVPRIRHLFGTAVVPRMELLPGGEPLPEYVRLFEARDLPVDLAPAAVVDPTPPSMRLATEPDCLDMRYIPYNGPGVAPAWLTEPVARPRICVTWGHTAVQALGDGATLPYRSAIEALAELDVEIVVVTTGRQLELLGSLPTGVRPAASLPLHLVLPHCDVLVQQGGDGTTLTAASLGVPQVAISRKPDAEVAPSRVVAAGAGMHLRYQELPAGPAGAEVIRAAVEKLLVDPAYPQAARRLRAEIARQPAPAEIVPALARFAEEKETR
jgi:UDP:flavonoid glycosyltransferase YjiC (YdhE family)